MLNRNSAAFMQKHTQLFWQKFNTKVSPKAMQSGPYSTG